ncbi:MAG: alkaline phosphatase, partial [Burkholderiales bacterium]
MDTMQGRLASAARRGSVALFALLALLWLAGCAQVAPLGGQAAAPKNIIIMFGDGAAATQWEFGRYTSRELRSKPFAVTDVVFKTGALGLLTTHSADSFVTDSAAAATALSTGHRTNNGMAAMT